MSEQSDQQTPGENAIDVSIVVPMYNEAGGAAALVDEIAESLKGRSFEIVVVNDCSSDGTLDVLKAAKDARPELRIISHEKNAGQSRAVRTGILAANGAVIGTLDGDGQNDPADLPALLNRLQKESDGTVMVAGERLQRKDSAAKRFASRLANGFRRRVLKDGASDTGCGLKVFYRSAFLRLPYFDHMHRYLPALMRREGYEVAFEPVGHRPRLHGASKYNNLGRLAVAFRDVLGVAWLLARSRPPGTCKEVENSALQREKDCDKLSPSSALRRSQE